MADRDCFGPEYVPTYTEEEATARAEKFIAEGYYSTSNRYRLISKVPEGMTAYEALCQMDPTWRERFEQQARSQYLRCYAPKECHVELDRETFRAFKKLGGDMA